MSLTIAQARDDLLSKLGIELAADADALTLQDVVVAINGAMQMLQTAGQDYFTREELTLTLSAGTSTYNVPRTLQAVLGPVRWNDTKPLDSLASQGEIDQYSRIFGSGQDYGAGSAGDPEAYWVRYLRSGTSGEICLASITLAPAPASPAGTLVLEIVNDAPAYAVSDLSSTTVLPVAQNYTESIFLPIARMLVTRSSQFSRPDILPQLTTDYQVAMQTLGLAGGFPNAEQPEPSRASIG